MNLSAYIRSLLIGSAVFSVLSAALPLKKSGLASYVRYVMALAVILAAILPLTTLGGLWDSTAGALGELFGQEASDPDADATTDAILREAASRMADSVADILAEQYGFDRTGLLIEVALDDSDPGAVRIESIRVTADSLPPLVTAAYLSSYLSKLIGCPVTVT